MVRKAPEADALTGPDLCFLPATELLALLRAGEVSAVETLEAHLAQIERTNPRVNAIVTLVTDAARAVAEAADQRRTRGEPLGRLHGLPVAHKDLVDTAGIRTTYGSTLFRDHVPSQNAIIVERLQQAGAITVGKTNTPEFGAGSQTFNEVFGTTRNPYDPTQTSGGSSGGAAAALACGMVPIADGSDLGGSLRNPASFCNVVGFRPSAGRVPSWPAEAAWFGLAVEGPMARTVADAALMLSVLAGPDIRAPACLAEPGDVFAGSLERDFGAVRVAWATDLGLPFEPEVLRVVNGCRATFQALGCSIEDAQPNLAGAEDVFSTWRAWFYALRLARFAEQDPGKLKDTIRWNVEQGLALSGQDLAQAEVLRTQLYHRLRGFMDQFPFFVLPTVQVVPFDATLEYPPAIAGEPMEDYIAWMKSCSLISATGHPAISVPAGFTSTGLPIGLQIVGRHRDDLGVLQLGHAFEQATRHWTRRPPLATEVAR